MRLPYTINKKIEWIIILLLILNIALGFYFLGVFPDQVPTHFDVTGTPDDYSGKTFAAFFVPILLIGLYLLLTFLPLADPKKDRYQDFSRTYGIIKLLLIVYMTVIYIATSLFALGYTINITTVTFSSMGVLFIVLGNFMPKLKPTWFVGIRTPWTLSDEEVWYKTHRLAGKAFFLGGLLMILATFLPAAWVFWIFISVAIIIVLSTVFYSWWIFQKKQNKKAS